MNAVLRSCHEIAIVSRFRLVHRRAKRFPYLEISLSHPRWLAERWLRRYGFDGADAGKRSTIPLRRSPSAHRLKTTAEASSVIERPRRGSRTCAIRARWLIVKSGKPVAHRRCRALGCSFFRMKPTQLVALLVRQRGLLVALHMRITGGKTTAMAAMADDRAEIVAATCAMREGSC